MTRPARSAAAEPLTQARPDGLALDVKNSVQVHGFQGEYVRQCGAVSTVWPLLLARFKGLITEHR